MFEKYLIETQGAKNVVEAGKVVGFEFRMRLSYYRGIVLAILADLRVSIGGEPVAREAIRLVVDGRVFTLDEAGREETVRWELDRAIGVRVMRDGGLPEGQHDIAIEQEIKPAYIPAPIKLVGKAGKSITLLHPDQTPPAEGPILGVSLYSYQEEYFTRRMTLDDCLAEVAAMGAKGVQLIPEQMLEGYPNPSDAVIARWHEALARYDLVPTMMDTFVDTDMGGHRQMTLDEGVETLVRQMELAKKMGFSVIRPTTGPVEDAAPDMIAKALPHAERLGVSIAPEIHAPIELRGPYIDSYLELIHKTGTQHLGFTLDLGIFCRELPRPACDQAIRMGADPELVDYIAASFHQRIPQPEVLETVKARGGNGAAIFLASIYKVFGPPNNQVEDLELILPYIKNVHGKFYDMPLQGDEPGIPTTEIIKALVRGGYRGSIDSEYEGQRMMQDAFDIDSCEQVRRQHRLIREILGQ